MEACIEEIESTGELEFHECEEITSIEEPVPRLETTSVVDTSAAHTSAGNPSCSVRTESQTSSFCWLCKFHGNPVCDKAIIFVVDSISHISFSNIIEQLFEHLHSSFPDDNISKQQLSTHIREHMLHPRIKMARMIHRLSDMQSSITQNIVSHDAESEQTIIDASAVKLYTLLSNQISSLYKLDEDKLMFKNISMDK
jgi:hypothetical protein